MAICIALGCAFVRPAQGQTTTLRFRHLGTEQGLSQSAVMAILQDRRGFVWLGTQDGLDRYDGVEFLHFRNHPDAGDGTVAAGLSSNFVRALAEDRSGRLWIGTNATGIDRYDPATGRFDNFRHQPDRPGSLPGNRIRALAVDGDGWLWAATAENGLARLDPVTGEAVVYQHDPEDPESLVDNNLTSLLVDRSGRLWIGSRGGLDCFDPHSGKFLHYPHDPARGGSAGEESVRALYEDGHGRIWIGTHGGLDLLDPARGSFRHFRPEQGNPYALSAPPVRALVEDGFGRLWVGTDRGIHLYDEELDRFEHHRHDPSSASSLSKDVITTFFRDRGGLVWVGTQGGSANIWDPATRFFSHVSARPDDPAGLPSDTIQAFAEIGPTLFVGTHGGGLAALDRGSGRFETFRMGPGGLADDRVMSLAADPAGRLFVGTFGSGLQRFDPRTRRFESWRHQAGDPRGLGFDGVSTLLVDRRGRLFVGSYVGGLDRFDAARGEFVHYRFAADDPYSLPSDAVTALAEAADGGLFVGTDSAGLAYLAADGARVVRFVAEGSSQQGSGQQGTGQAGSGQPGSGQPGLGTVRALHVDTAGALWVGTGDAGVLRIDGFDPASGRGRVHRFAERDGAPIGTVWGIQPDSRGRLWLSTNRGLSELDPQRESFRGFTARYGLQADEFNFGAHFRSARGELFFGGNHGYNSFFPEQLAFASQPPAVVITSITRRGALLRPEALAGSPPLVELDHHDSVVSIEFAALDFAAPDENRYRFRLEGFDDAWSQPAKNRPATFTNLDPGSYLFRVAAANADGVWNDQGAALAVRVLPAPWETWWAVGLYLLGAGALIGQGIRWRLAGLERSRHELQQLVDTRTAELSQTVAQLSLSEQSALDAKMRALRALEDALEERRKAQDASRAKSSFLSNISHELRTPLNAVLGFAQLLERDERLRGDQRENLAVILRSGEHLLGLINDVLSFAKIESGRLTLTEAPFELRRVIRDVEDMMRVRADAKGLKLEVEVESALPNVCGDEGRITQILLNLLGNAVKFTARGGVRLVAAWHEGRASFAVIDTGCGIAEAELAQLFQPFVQARGGRQHGEGTGLGLAICHKLVALMGGELEVSSEVGAGSTFSFAIPLPATALGESAPRRGRVVGLEPGQPPLRVLVADDAAENRDLLLRLLEPLGIEVEAVADGEAAVQRWSEWGPHLILMDIRMPRLDGYGAIRKIRKNEAELGGRTPILAITATAFEHDRRRMLAAGCDDVLTKPFRSQALFDLMAELLDLRFVHADDTPSGGAPRVHPGGAPRPAEPLRPSDAAPRPSPVTALTMPAAPVAAPPSAASLAGARRASRRFGRGDDPAAETGGVPLAGKRILVVDDNDANRLVAQRALERLGCQVDLATDGIEALEVASTAAYDLIFMDVQMPRLDGISATRRLRAERGPSQDSPVVALTGLPTPDEYRSCLAAGMSDLLAKPFRLDDLRLLVERFAKKGAAPEAAPPEAAPPQGAPAEAAPSEVAPAAATEPTENAGAPTSEPAAAPPAETPVPATAAAAAAAETAENGSSDTREDTREVYIAEIIKLFLETAPFQLEALRAAAAGFDLGRLAHLAATLRGSSNNFTADALGQACHRLETLCSASDAKSQRAEITVAIDELAHELRRTIQQLRHLQAARAASAGAGRH